MKKRLRKKRRLGEFREDCFGVEFDIDQNLPPHKRDQVLDRFLAMIEAAGLQFGGGGNGRWTGIVEFCGRGSATEVHRAKVTDWLDQQSEIQRVAIGPLVDAWR